MYLKLRSKRDNLFVFPYVRYGIKALTVTTATFIHSDPRSTLMTATEEEGTASSKAPSREHSSAERHMVTVVVDYLFTLMLDSSRPAELCADARDVGDVAEDVPEGAEHALQAEGAQRQAGAQEADKTQEPRKKRRMFLRFRLLFDSFLPPWSPSCHFPSEWPHSLGRKGTRPCQKVSISLLMP